MNEKQAKLIRKLAGVTSETQKSRSYSGIESTQRIRVHKEVDFESNEYQEVSRITTHTYVLNQSPRKLYQTMKKAAVRGHLLRSMN
jgi:hypothetical protein